MDGPAGGRPCMSICAGAAAAQKVHDDVEHLRVQNRRSLEIFSGRGGAGEHENARADDGADAQRGQRPRAQSLLQALARSFGFGDQLVDRLAAEKLVVGGTDDGSGFGGVVTSGCGLLKSTPGLGALSQQMSWRQ